MLTQARVNKKDEFYTQYKDVETEINKISSQFSDKSVYCPCDSESSNFVKFFKDNFQKLDLKFLYYSDIDNGAFEYNGVEETRISGPISIQDGSFIDMLSNCDIVITNPPFSLFNDFLCNLVENNKKFLIVGNQNAITSKRVFSTIQNNNVQIDFSGFKGLAGYFITPDDYNDYAASVNHIDGFIRVSGVVWYTNIDGVVNNEGVEFGMKFDPNIYKFYDNFRTISGLSEDCINIDKTKDIPSDWYGYIGVPISFMSKYNPEQFDIIQLDHYGPLGNLDNVVDGKSKYRRIYIRRKH